MAYLPIINVEGLAAEMHVEELARRNGRLDMPPTGSSDLDTPQRRIVGNMIEMVNGARATCLEKLNALSARRNEIDVVTAIRAVRQLPDDCRIIIDRVLAKHYDQLLKTRSTQQRMLREFKFFVEENHLDREPQYPESSIFHWSIVVALVLIESIANSYFFAKGSDFGLIGGAFQALLISAVNIGFSLLTGMYVLPNLRHVVKARRIGAGAVSGLYGVVMLFFNLATAHYRQQLEINPLKALTNTIPALRSAPFDINNFDANTLMFIGFIFAVAALIKAFTADDPYPGYGSLHRRYKASAEAYEAAKQDARRNVNDAFDKYRWQLNQILDDARANSRDFPLLLNETEAVAADYARFAAEANSACQTLLKIYRSTNLRVRTAPPPAYFDDYPPLDVPMRLPIDNYDAEKARAKEMGGQISTLEDGYEATLELFQRVNDEICEKFDSFVQGIEEDAKKIAESIAAKAEPDAAANG